MQELCRLELLINLLPAKPPKLSKFSIVQQMQLLIIQYATVLQLQVCEAQQPPSKPGKQD